MSVCTQRGIGERTHSIIVVFKKVCRCNQISLTIQRPSLISFTTWRGYSGIYLCKYKYYACSDVYASHKACLRCTGCNVIFSFCIFFSKTMRRKGMILCSTFIYSERGFSLCVVYLVLSEYLV